MIHRLISSFCDVILLVWIQTCSTVCSNRLYCGSNATDHLPQFPTGRLPHSLQEVVSSLAIHSIAGASGSFRFPFSASNDVFITFVFWKNVDASKFECSISCGLFISMFVSLLVLFSQTWWSTTRATRNLAWMPVGIWVIFHNVDSCLLVGLECSVSGHNQAMSVEFVTVFNPSGVGQNVPIMWERSSTVDDGLQVFN